MACWGLWDIGRCGCPSGSCSVTFTVAGCNAIVDAFDTLTVSVWDSSNTTQLATGTTTTGVITLSWTGTSGAYHVHVSGQNARFDSYDVMQTLMCGGTETLQLVPASGFVCITGCFLPLKTTLTLTDSVIGTCTLTFSGINWTGSLSYSYPGFTNPTCLCFCSPVTMTVGYQLSTSLTLGWLLASSGCPTAHGPLVVATNTGIIESQTDVCPVPFSLTHDVTLDTCAAGNCSLGSSPEPLWALYGGFPGDVATITVTE